MGAALLQTPDKLVAILEALVRNVAPEANVGISVKIRLLETAEQTEVLVRRLCATGITGLTVHCRTTPMRPREKAIRGQLRMVADVCREAGVACLMNGDVESREQAVKLVEEFAVDGAMIATAAEKNMSCFRTEAEGGLASWKDAFECFLRFAMDVENKFGNTKFMMLNIVPGKQAEYTQLHQAKSYTAICEMLGFEHLLAQAGEVDDALDLSPKALAAAKLMKEQAQKEKKLQQKQNKQNRNMNATAHAAGGNMAQARAVQQPRKSLSERRVKSAPEIPQAQAPDSGVAVPV